MVLTRRLGLFLLPTFIAFASVQDASAQHVPGTGTRLSQVGDDFEDENWAWVPNGPKASKEQDEQIRQPLGYSTNRRWFESPKRGQPDILKRVPTPAGGIPGSKGALLIQTTRSGVPGHLSYEMMQDDLVLASTSRIGMLSAARTPQAVTRVYLPPFDQWENRTGTHFGYRIDCKTTIVDEEAEDRRPRFLRRFRRKKEVKKTEPYWPGFFIQFYSETDAKVKKDMAKLIIRGNSNGNEVRGRAMTPGWWTLGMSVTPDGQVHFYASEGVDKLTPADYLYSSFPYGYQAENFATQFFNICNRDDGRTISTPFIIDDPAIYVKH